MNPAAQTVAQIRADPAVFKLNVVSPGWLLAVSVPLYLLEGLCGLKLLEG